MAGKSEPTSGTQSDLAHDLLNTYTRRTLAAGAGATLTEPTNSPDPAAEAGNTEAGEARHDRGERPASLAVTPASPRAQAATSAGTAVDIPAVGWRRLVQTATFGALRLPPSSLDRYCADLVTRMRSPMGRPFRVAVVSIKGGVGKTTTSALLGFTFATYRGAVAVVDANPDAGTLAQRTVRGPAPTVRGLLETELRARAGGGVGMFDPRHIRSQTGLAMSRLHIIASDQDPDIGAAFSQNDYCTVQDVLGRAFNLIITDSGTGLRHSAMQGTLELADAVIVVAAARSDAALRAKTTLDELEARGYAGLAKEAIAVITMDRLRPRVDVDGLENYFRTRCRAVLRIPYDDHLSSGSMIDYGQVARGTHIAYMQLGALVSDGFAATK